MRVRATQLGYDGFCRRKPGTIFTLKDPKMFSKSWMEKIDDTPSAEPKKSKVSAPAESKPVGDQEVI